MCNYNFITAPLLQNIDLEDEIADLTNSFNRGGSKFNKPPLLKKLGSATTKPKVETSIVWTWTTCRLNSLALAASNCEYFWSL